MQPESYWTPLLGNAYIGPGVAITDIKHMTPEQLFHAVMATKSEDE